MRFRLSTFILISLLISVVLRLCLSNGLLNRFYPYSYPGGSFYYKIHPGSVVILFTFLVVFFLRDPVVFVKEQRDHQFSVFQFAVVIVLIAAVSVFRYGFGGMAYLIDSFASAIICAMLMAYISKNQKNTLVTTVFFVAVINSIIALIEFFMKFNLIGTEFTFGFFRSTALFGHPLANALITVIVAMGGLKMNWSFSVKTIFISLMVLSIFAFGARGSMASLLTGIVVALGLSAFFNKKTTFRGRIGNILALYTGGLTLILVVYILIFHTAIGETIATRLMMDRSIEARLNSVSILGHISTSDMISGFSPQRFESKIDKLGVVEIVENFWVILLLRLGLPLFVVFTASFFYLIWGLTKEGTWNDAIIALVFLAAASTNNSLYSKNAAFYIFLVMILFSRTIGPSEIDDKKYCHVDQGT